MTTLLRRSLVFLAIAGVPLPVFAATPAEVVGWFIHRGEYYEEFAKSAMETFRRADRDRDGVTADEVDLAIAIGAARRRTDRVASLLRFDFNGDGVVTQQEVEGFFRQ